MSDELLPCPFCGAQPVVHHPRWTDDSIYAYCIGCDARGPYGKTKKDATTAWNRHISSIPADVREAIITLVDFGVMDSHDYHDTEPQRKLIRSWLRLATP